MPAGWWAAAWWVGGGAPLHGCPRRPAAFTRAMRFPAAPIAAAWFVAAAALAPARTLIHCGALLDSIAVDPDGRWTVHQKVLPPTGQIDNGEILRVDTTKLPAVLKTVTVTVHVH